MRVRVRWSGRVKEWLQFTKITHIERYISDKLITYGIVQCAQYTLRIRIQIKAGKCVYEYGECQEFYVNFKATS